MTAVDLHDPRQVAIATDGVVKVFGVPPNAVAALDNVSLAREQKCGSRLPFVFCRGRGMKGVELYGRVRYAVRIEGLSERAAARRFGIYPAVANRTTA